MNPQTSIHWHYFSSIVAAAADIANIAETATDIVGCTAAAADYSFGVVAVNMMQIVGDSHSTMMKLHSDSLHCHCHCHIPCVVVVAADDPFAASDIAARGPSRAEKVDSESLTFQRAIRAVIWYLWWWQSSSYYPSDWTVQSDSKWLKSTARPGVDSIPSPLD